MATKIVALDKELHKHLRVKKNTTYEHAMNTHLCLVQAHEFILASLDYPIVFVKDPDTGEFRSVVMLGLTPSENLYYHTEQWRAAYVPASIQLFPWGLAPSANDPARLSLGLDMENSLVNSSEGMALFDDDGEESEYLNNIKNYVGTVHSQTPVTLDFIKYINEAGLLSPQSLTINTGKDSKPAFKIDGIYAVDIKTLDNLSNEAFLVLRERQYLPIIYAHLASLAQVNQLAQRKATLDRDVQSTAQA